MHKPVAMLWRSVFRQSIDHVKVGSVIPWSWRSNRFKETRQSLVEDVNVVYARPRELREVAHVVQGQRGREWAQTEIATEGELRVAPQVRK